MSVTGELFVGSSTNDWTPAPLAVSSKWRCRTFALESQLAMFVKVSDALVMLGGSSS